MLSMYPIFILEKSDCVPWQIIELSRDYFGMSDLEKATESGGSLLVRIGDALSPSATVEGGFAGEQLTMWMEYIFCTCIDCLCEYTIWLLLLTWSVCYSVCRNCCRFVLWWKGHTSATRSKYPFPSWLLALLSFCIQWWLAYCSFENYFQACNV